MNRKFGKPCYRTFLQMFFSNRNLIDVITAFLLIDNIIR